ncbi:MAG: ATP-grasp domain-containing protein [Phycisphaerae bacterium]|nr:ATP-grasp domain-containing protein [Phycisphaerae bacterium]
MIVAFEDEPLPESPVGISMAIKLRDWLDLARMLPDADLDIRPISELDGDSPDIVEAFATREAILGPRTFPTAAEHSLSSDICSYWPAVEQSGIPAIPVLPAGTVPTEFPVYIRGRTGSFTRGIVRSREELLSLCTGVDVVVRPFVAIERCGLRSSVTKELRVHVVCRRAACVEFLFPAWAAQHPSVEERAEGCEWAAAVSADVVRWAESLASFLDCRWFTADFASTPGGTQLIELNPGWCSGATDASSARAVHLAILDRGFGVSIPAPLWPQPVAGITYVGRP